MKIYKWPGDYAPIVEPWATQFGPNIAIVMQMGIQEQLHSICKQLTEYADFADPSLCLIWSGETPNTSKEDDLYWMNMLKEYRAIIDIYKIPVSHIYFDIECYQPHTLDEFIAAKRRITTVIDYVCKALNCYTKVVYGDNWQIESINTNLQMVGIHTTLWSDIRLYGNYPSYVNMHWQFPEYAIRGLLSTATKSSPPFVQGIPVHITHWIDSFKNPQTQSDEKVKPTMELCQRQYNWAKLYKQMNIPYVMLYDALDPQSILLDAFKSGTND